MEFETLYKRSSSGAILEWTISTYMNVVTTEAGQVGGAITTSTYETTEKNFGRSNYTTAEDQAISEAQSKFDHQIKYNGYFRTIEMALASTQTMMPAGGYKPMKAHKWDDHKHKLSYPLYVQPKIDGMRCIAVKSNDEVKLYASSGREIKNLKHIKDELIQMLHNGDVIDGELYKHGMPLNQILSIVKREVNPASVGTQEQIKYHMFDSINLVDISGMNDRFQQRFLGLANRYGNEAVIAIPRHLHLVMTTLAIHEYDAERIYLEFVKLGYEGMMYRSVAGSYQQKRSYGIQKRKDFKEEDFLIVGVEDGIGKAAGLAVNFICLTENEQVTFKAPINDTEEARIELFNDESLWRDKFATVRFLNYSEYGVPVIPKCIAIRDQKGVD